MSRIDVIVFVTIQYKIKCKTEWLNECTALVSDRVCLKLEQTGIRIIQIHHLSRQ